MRERFEDRAEAGRLLAAALPPLDAENTVVAALPRGGVPVAAEICRDRGLPLDLVLVRKIGAPGQQELALGAIVDGAEPQVIVNPEIAAAFGLKESDVRALGDKLLPEIERRRGRYLGTLARPALAGKTVVVVDDGVATGATLRAGLKAVRAAGAGRVILALPVAPGDVLPRLEAEADETVCLRTPTPFLSVGSHYRRFGQTSDEEVAALVAELAPAPGG